MRANANFPFLTVAIVLTSRSKVGQCICSRAEARAEGKKRERGTLSLKATVKVT
jgi:hypothetical protein